MFHIVFDSRGAELLNAAMDLDEALDGEVVLMQDGLSVGPIQDLSCDEGIAERKKWWNEIRQDAGESLTEASDSAR